ncbi:hypothetical protein DUI87_24785 [Hirundo rustica rustica]|uniref:Uncharacterized protein n=1 Tax=Hirundo rustica rustica TaxID=333673 RepID=A0A3M0JIK2_HIRRU|nr:hypothetical protein DUI87_24785 [Hirundo rustica rustica]
MSSEEMSVHQLSKVCQAGRGTWPISVSQRRPRRVTCTLLCTLLCTLDPPEHRQCFSLVLRTATKSKFYLNRRKSPPKMITESFRLEKTIKISGSSRYPSTANATTDLMSPGATSTRLSSLSRDGHSTPALGSCANACPLFL